LDEWKPMEKCHRCPRLIVVLEEKIRFLCGKASNISLVVPYVLVGLWQQSKQDEQEVDCPGVQGPKAEPRVWRMKRTDQFCPECELTMDPVEGMYLEFTYTLYQLYQCRCGYQVYCLVSRIKRSKKASP